MSGAHVLTGEQSRFRRWTLYLFARYVEMPLLAWGYALLRGRYRRWGRNRLVRAALSWTVAIPFGYLGDTARPIPTPEVLRLIDGLEPAPTDKGPLSTTSIAVGPCRCRSAHGGCSHPLETDLVIRTGIEAWTRAFPHDYRPISREEAKEIVSECSRQGMWQMVFIHCPVHREKGAGVRNEYVICNCCICGCVPYILNRELGQRMYPLLRGTYVADTDPARCAEHGSCITACPFGVRALVGEKVQLAGSCFGCGVCVAACPEGAIVMREA